MFKRRRQTEEEDIWSDWSDDGDENTSVRSKKWPVLFTAAAVLLLLMAGSGAFWVKQRSAPTYAAEKWLDAMWTADGYEVMELTCDEQVWVSNLVNSGSVIQGLVKFLGITSIPALDELGLDVDILGLGDQFEVERSQIKFTEVRQGADSALVTATGRLRIRVFGGWFPYRLNEQWVMVREDDRWRWCGRQP